MLKKLCLLAVVALLWSLPGGKVAQADLLVRGYSAGTANFYDRFNNSPQFIGNPFDWSGIGRSAGGRWGTMVSANYFLSAAHFAPGAGDTLTFYGSNDLNGPSQTVNIVSGQQIAGTDLYLGRIDQPTNFTTYGVVSSTNVVGHDVFMFGQLGNSSVEMRLGRNTVEAYFENFSDPLLGASTGDVYIYDYDSPTGGVGDAEAKVQGGDSGAPTFMIVNGRPVLLGFHWFAFNGDFSDTTAGGSGDTATARYITALNQAMVGQQLITVVPEPGSLALVALPMLGLWGRRRWAKSIDSKLAPPEGQ